MSESKFVKGILYGAILGGALTMLDRKTRDSVMNQSRRVRNEIKYYNKNRDELKQTIEQQVTKWQSVYNQFTSDAKYISQKVNEVKEITPQVKTLVTDTKDTFSQSKEEYKSIVVPENEEPKSIYEPKLQS
ncbi:MULTISPECIES: YtxH domain-containing protein [unclassified Psychrobacillus]|uniref:YtxH domain-containing protein n=1 Tax=unclassified Psychrobacillus TaxID=2636677 RepID=UPI0011A29FB8|nr:YtxH domain-containing protein [Bacillus sp. N3536]